MKKFSSLGLVAILGTAFLSTSTLANGLQEDRSYQHQSVNQKFLMLNQELTRIKLKEGGFKQIFNVTADGGATVYVGNNTQVAGNQHNNTSVGNMTSLTIHGDNNTMSSNAVSQDNQDAEQVAVGADIGTGGGNVGDYIVGLPLGNP